jgi:hypothetical protein
LVRFKARRLRAERLQLLECLADELRKISVVGVVDPSFERDPEHRHPDLGGERRGRVWQAARAQRLGQGGRQGCERDQLAFSELGVCGDDGLARPRGLAVLGPAMAPWPLPLRTLLLSVLMVVAMTWLVIPSLTRLFQGWLTPVSPRSVGPAPRGRQ